MKISQIIPSSSIWRFPGWVLYFLFLRLELLFLLQTGMNLVSGIQFAPLRPGQRCYFARRSWLKLKANQTRLVERLQEFQIQQHPEIVPWKRTLALTQFLEMYPTFHTVQAYFENEMQIERLVHEPTANCYPITVNSFLNEMQMLSARVNETLNDAMTRWAQLSPTFSFYMFVKTHSAVLEMLHSYYKLVRSFQYWRMNIQPRLVPFLLNSPELFSLRKKSCRTATILNLLHTETQRFKFEEQAVLTEDLKLLKELIETVEHHWYRLYISPKTNLVTLGCAIGWDIVEAQLSVVAKAKLYHYAHSQNQKPPCQGRNTIFGDSHSGPSVTCI